MVFIYKLAYLLPFFLFALFIDAQSANSENSCASFNGFDHAMATKNDFHSLEYFLYSHKDSLKTEYKEKIIDCIVNGDLEYEYDPDMYGSSRKNHILDDFQRAILFVCDEDQAVQSAVVNRAEKILLNADNSKSRFRDREFILGNSTAQMLYRLFFQINHHSMLNKISTSDFNDKADFYIIMLFRSRVLNGYELTKSLLQRLEELKQRDSVNKILKLTLERMQIWGERWFNSYLFLQNKSDKYENILHQDLKGMLQIVDFVLEKGNESREMQIFKSLLQKSIKKDSLHHRDNVVTSFLNSIEKFESGRMISKADMQNWNYLFNTDVYTPNIYKYVNKMYGEYQRKSNNENKQHQ